MCNKESDNESVVTFMEEVTASFVVLDISDDIKLSSDFLGGSG